MVFCPAIVDVLEEGRVVDLHLGEHTGVSARAIHTPFGISTPGSSTKTPGGNGVTGAMAKQVLIAAVGVSLPYLFFVHPQKRLHRRVRAGKKAERQVSNWGSRVVQSQAQLPAVGTLWEEGTEGVTQGICPCGR